jgi:hypothetical protein
MALDKYIEKKFPIKCFGRDSEGKPVLETPVKFKLNIHQRPGDDENISVSVDKCPYNTGGHGQRCRASHPPGVDKIGVGIICPFTLSLPGGVEYLLSRMNKP